MDIAFFKPVLCFYDGVSGGVEHEAGGYASSVGRDDALAGGNRIGNSDVRANLRHRHPLVLACENDFPVVLAEGMEKLCSPLKKWKVPVHDAVMMFSIALRFVPLLLEEFDTVRKAQIARGGGFHRKGAMSRFKGVLPMLIPLFVLSIHRAKDLAIAMESRGYQGEEGRTPIREYRIRPSDVLVLTVSILFLVSVALV